MISSPGPNSDERTRGQPACGSSRNARAARRADNSRVTNPQWSQVKDWFDPHENGTVPDLVVAGTSLGDWEALLALIRTQGWRREYDFDDHRTEPPSSAVKLFDAGSQGKHRTLRVWPDPGIEIIFRP